MRSLATLAKAHSDFVTKGKSDHSRVKEFYNVLSPPILVIPLDHVCIKQEMVKLTIELKSTIGQHAWAPHQLGRLLQIV